MPLHSNSILHVIGVPLNENELLNAKATEVLKNCKVFIGESRKLALRYLNKSGIETQHQTLFFLDQLNSKTLKEIRDVFRTNQKIEVALFSDTGMPILFDPGKEILEIAKELKFEIKTVPGPTSWGMACSLSGFEPPFFIEGFPPQKTEARIKRLEELKNTEGHIVLMDTPYRYLSLLDQLIQTQGANRETFLAWEIGCQNEFYFWGTLNGLKSTSFQKKMEKGEFVLILKSIPR